MTDREQVIAELEYMKRDVLEDSDKDMTLNKAIALLKEQEARILPAVNGLARAEKEEDISRRDALKIALEGIQRAGRE